AQINQAAEDLARDSKTASARAASAAAKPAAAAPAPAPRIEAKAAAAPANARRPAETKGTADLRPIEPSPAPATPSAFAHANDDRQRDYRSLQSQIRRSSPRTIY